MTFVLTVYRDNVSVLRTDCYGETPAVGDLITAHPDGVANERSVTARVTGVQRVLRPVLSAPGVPQVEALGTKHVAVTAKVEG